MLGLKHVFLYQAQQSTLGPEVPAWSEGWQLHWGYRYLGRLRRERLLDCHPS